MNSSIGVFSSISESNISSSIVHPVDDVNKMVSGAALSVLNCIKIPSIITTSLAEVIVSGATEKNSVAFKNFNLFSTIEKEQYSPSIVKDSFSEHLVEPETHLFLQKPDGENRDEKTPLHLALSDGSSPATIKSLIESGSSLDARNHNGETPLHIALVSGSSPEIIQALIEAGSPLDVRDNNENTPLHIALYSKCSPEVIGIFIKANPPLNMKSHYGYTPLHFALYSKHPPEVIRSLLEAGASLDVQDHGENTPLHFAIHYKLSSEIIKILIESGAPLDIKDSGRNTPLHLALYYNYSNEIIKMFITSGAPLDAKNEYECTPLHYALYFYYPSEIIKTLVKAGAPLNVIDSAGKTPLNLSIEYKDPSLISFFVDYGASYSASAEIFHSYTKLTGSLRKSSEIFDPSLEQKEYHYQKLIGHTLSIKGLFGNKIHKDREGVSYASIWNEFLADNLMSFSSIYPNKISDEESELITKLLHSETVEKTPKELLKIYQNEEPLLISSGFKDHSVRVLLWKELMIIANKGTFSRFYPIDIRNIDPKAITVEQIEEILNLKSSSKSDFRNWLIKTKQLMYYDATFLTDLITKHYLSPIKQSVGNCSYESLMTMIEATLMLHRLRELLKSEYYSKKGLESIDEMLKEINPTLVALRQHIGLSAIEDYLFFHDQQDGTENAEIFDRDLVNTAIQRAERSYPSITTADQTKRTAQLFQRFQAKLNATKTEQCSELKKDWYNSPLSYKDSRLQK